MDLKELVSYLEVLLKIEKESLMDSTLEIDEIQKTLDRIKFYENYLNDLLKLKGAKNYDTKRL